MSTWTHIPVLLQPTIDALVSDPGGLYIDGTFGCGGHTGALLARLQPGARVIAFDRDPDAIARGQSLAARDSRLTLVHAPFSQMGAYLRRSHGVPHTVSGIMLDLGLSSPQVDNPARGMSFMRDGPLDMRMDRTRGESACEWLAGATQAQIAQVLHEFGQERYAGRIAAAIVAARAHEGGRASEAGTRTKPNAVSGRLPTSQPPHALETTGELARLVEKTIAQCGGRRTAGHHPATRTFQALRIFVNDELGELERALQEALVLLAPQGRLAVISFHSLEDRRVKHFIATHSRAPEVRRHSPASIAPKQGPLRLKSLGKTLPGAAECKANPRSRSAVLRVAARTTEALAEVFAQPQGRQP